ncbi:MAG: urease accessory UreF family protein [Pseudomonadota bacterium]
MTTLENADLLKLTHWLSPVFPVGGYAYSHGLEHAIQTGDIASAADLEAWLRVVLARGSGLADAVLLARAQAGEDCALLNDWAAALAASSERWQETREQGVAFTRSVNAVNSQDADPLALPVAVGRAAAGLSISATPVVALYLQSFVANLVIGAVRHVPLGQEEGQRVIVALQSTVLETAQKAVDMKPKDVRGAAFGSDMAAMRHETQDVRIFRT